jgi:bla regulator protein BlaR1
MIQFLKRFRGLRYEKLAKDKIVIPSCCARRNSVVTIMTTLFGLCQFALCQALPTANQQPPRYEVATIKPAKDGLGPTLGVYILAAFGMPGLSPQRLVGPEWINKATYDIRGKVPDSLQEAMSRMTRDERLEQTELMMQSLLADRFGLKYHFEAREMQVYRLVLAKGGLKMKELSDLSNAAGVRMSRNKVSFITGAAEIPDLIGLLGNFPEIGAKPILNETGLSGKFYDISLRWTSSVASDPANNTPTASDTDEPSLFTAVQEQLGLKLVAGKGPVKVLVIDHIQPPSEN